MPSQYVSPETLEFAPSHTEAHGKIVPSRWTEGRFVLRGELRVLDARGQLRGSRVLAEELGAGAPLEVQDENGVWTAGRVEHDEARGYFFGAAWHHAEALLSCSLAELAKREVAVRQVRP